MPVPLILVAIIIVIVAHIMIKVQEASSQDVIKKADVANNLARVDAEKARIGVTLNWGKNVLLQRYAACLEAMLNAGEIRTPLVDPVTGTLADARGAKAWLDTLIVVCEQGHRHTHDGFVVAMGTQTHTTVGVHTEHTQVSGQSQLYHTTPNGWADRQVGMSDYQSSLKRDVYIPETVGNVVERHACPTCGTDLFSFEGQLRGYRVCRHHIIHDKLHDKWYGHPLYHVYADKHLQCPVCVLDRQMEAALKMLQNGKVPPILEQPQRAVSALSAPQEPVP